MKDICFELKKLCQAHKDGSFATRANRHTILQQCAEQLHQEGCKLKSASGLKPKHVNVLLKRWSEDGITAGTMKNRMTYLRWWAEKVGKSGLIAGGNESYGIEGRETGEAGRAWALDSGQLGKITDPYVRLSLRMQEAFGLRREESIKFNPSYADKGDGLVLKPSWTKGGRGRMVPISSPEQRALLDEVKALCGEGALIPSDKRYIDQLKRYENQCLKAGLSNPHGLRHAYAQRRYKVLTGWDAPSAGGPGRKKLTEQERKQDKNARQQIANELGHNRIDVTNVYLGR